jgi:cytochrome P450
MTTTEQVDAGAGALDREVAGLVRCEEHVDDPYPLYARLREELPVYRCDELGLWLITGYAEAGEFLRHSAVSREERNSANYDPAGKRRGPVWELIDTWLMWRDPPEHTRLRRALTTMFAVRNVEAIRPAVDKTVAKMLDPLVGRGSMDFLNDFARGVPSTVLYDLLGVPRELQDTVQGYIGSVIKVLEPGAGAEAVQAANESMGNLRELVDEVVGDRRRNPRHDDLISHLANDKETLTDDELLGNVVFVIAAGGDSAGQTLANGLVGMLRTEGQLERLRADRSLVPTAVEEFLRWDGSNRNAIARWTTEQIEVGGVPIAAGEEVWVVLGAADRDPREFADPETFDIGRTPNRHIAFGLGNHACLGMHLARIEMHAALDAVIERLPDLRVDGEVHWIPSWLVRHLTALPVAWSTGEEPAHA